MRYHVVITDSALLDIESISQYVTEVESTRRSIQVVKAILKCVDTLERYPMRGAIPIELRASGSDTIRQLVVHHYRIMYYVKDSIVTIILVADGRRRLDVLIRSRIFAT